MKKILFLYFLLLFQFSYANDLSYEEIEDQNSLKILTPSLQERSTAKIRLKNGLLVFLISDPNADQSAASMAVEVGSWQDHPKFPGTAHFAEHLLFMGNKKYPNEKGFFKHITENSGSLNAYTADDRTVYIFSINHSTFEEALDRFSHFFIDPNLSESSMTREINAVHQEYEMYYNNELWRRYSVFKESSNINHPNSNFSIGNLDTLSDMKHDIMKEWVKDHYYASNMRLIVYSSQNIEDLKSIVTNIFTEIPEKDVIKNTPYQSLTSAQQRGHLIYTEPLEQSQVLILTWELSQEFTNDFNHTAELIAYALNRGQKRSLEEKLKNEKLAEAVEVDTSRQGYHNGLLSIEIKLTDLGVKNYKHVIQHSFEALAGLKLTGIPAYLFHENEQMCRLGYEYQQRSNAYQYVSNFAAKIFYEPFATFPERSILSTSYDSKKAHTLLRELTPKNCIYFLSAPVEKTQILPEKKEKWFKVGYTIQPIDEKELNSYAKVLPSSDIKLAEPNPFQPKNLDILPCEGSTNIPIKILENEMGKIYYSACGEFQIPKTAYFLHIRSPYLNESIESKVLSDIYIRHLDGVLSPALKAAANAGLSIQFNIDRNRFHLSLNGYHDKSLFLLEEILKDIHMAIPTKEQFNLYKESLIKEYTNFQTNSPFYLGLDIMKSMITQNSPTQSAKLEKIQEIEFKQFLQFQKDLFHQTYHELFLAGNLTPEDCESIWLDISHIFPQNPFPPHLHLPDSVLYLPQAEGPFMVHENSESHGNVSLLLLDLGPVSLKNKSIHDILSNAISEDFFNTLRTKQQTGYLVKSLPFEKENQLFQIFGVQSITHQPEDLVYRFELFIENYLKQLPFEFSEERFQNIKNQQITRLEKLGKNLYEKAKLWDQIAFEKQEDFNWIPKRIQALKKLPYKEFIQTSQSWLSRQNKKRLAVLLEGKIPENNSFVYESIAPHDLVEKSRYEIVELKTDNPTLGD